MHGSRHNASSVNKAFRLGFVQLPDDPRGEDGDQYLKGEWGMDDEVAGGGPWNAVKLRRGEPDRCTGADEPVTLEEKPHPWDEEDQPDD